MLKILKPHLILVFFASGWISPLQMQAQIQPSVAKIWADATLQCIRWDFARPTVHARNLFHISAAMYDSWCMYDNQSECCFLGKKIGDYQFVKPLFKSALSPDSSISITISYAAYRLLKHRFKNSPNAARTSDYLDSIFMALKFNANLVSIDYSGGNPACLGNYIAQSIIAFGLTDGSNETKAYTNNYYHPVNEPLYPTLSGNRKVTDINRWQPLGFNVFIDQSGNVLQGNVPNALSPEWGNVVPFSLTDSMKKIRFRDGNQYQIYLDPGSPPFFDTINPNKRESELFKWAFELVALYSAQLNIDDNVYWDISPAGSGNVGVLPDSVYQFPEFYANKDSFLGKGYTLNPFTGKPYASQMVLRGDFTRTLAEFWADGIESETPPGHWFYILGKVNYDSNLSLSYQGKYKIHNQLEWDIKSYLLMGGAMHDAAISTWSIKGWYDYVRPISVIRHLAGLGQCTDSTLPNFNSKGINLIPGFIEVVMPGDTLAKQSEDIYKIKLLTWKGHAYINNPQTDIAGVGWILAENWWPYQRPTFVTPPFPGYISGHSTFSHAGAQVLTMLTGSPFFPGGLGEFPVEKDKFLKFEKGPSASFKLQWAKYSDAADQSALSRIYGGIHPPIDDIPGRKNGKKIGMIAFQKATQLFYPDKDADGVPDKFDCNPFDATIYSGAPEICDGKDNNCNGLTDEGIDKSYTYYIDTDKDGFGNRLVKLQTCFSIPPAGYVADSTDCDDENFRINPWSAEICDKTDNNCNNLIDEGLQQFTYYLDSDGDFFGDENYTIQDCASIPPVGYCRIHGDCNDNNPRVYPGAYEFMNNGTDEDCNGFDSTDYWFVWPNPVTGNQVHITSPGYEHVVISIKNATGTEVFKHELYLKPEVSFAIDPLLHGIYFIEVSKINQATLHRQILIISN